jgi:hypothetical protein
VQLSAAILIQLGVALALGAAVFAVGGCLASRALGRGGRRRRLVSWIEAGRAGRSLLPVAFAIAVVGALLSWAGGLEPGRARWPSHAAFLAVGAVPAASAWLLLRAGRLERRGRVRVARRLARLGGELMFVGCLALLILMWIDLLFRPGFRVAVVRDDARAALELVAAMLGLGIAGFVAVLGGLAGKPRPAGMVAALIFVGAFACAALAADRVRASVDRLSYGRDEPVSSLLDCPRSDALHSRRSRAGA